MAKTGRRPAINPDDVLEKLENTDVLFHSTGEVADMMDASKPTVLDRLRTLEEQGRVRSREVAGNTPIWYLPEVENRRLDEYSNEAAREESDDTDDGRSEAHDTPGPQEPEPIADGMGLGRYIELQAAIWAQRSAGAGVVLALVGVLAWGLTQLPIPKLLPALAAVGAMLAGFVAILASLVLIGVAFLLATVQGHGHGEVVEYILERTLYPRIDSPARR